MEILRPRAVSALSLRGKGLVYLWFDHFLRIRMHQHFGPRVGLRYGFSGAVADGVGGRQGQLARQFKVKLHKPDIARDPGTQVVGPQHTG